ncbi:hypothetical protein HBB16_09715 [Pseudonocardia sp. MCCB 268]|nr:hypothetical protein [Pseudonocardia cytotoxica]
MVGDAGPQAYFRRRRRRSAHGTVFAAELALAPDQCQYRQPADRDPLNPTSTCGRSRCSPRHSRGPRWGRPEHLAQAILSLSHRRRPGSSPARRSASTAD